jgi:hypothetical protein
MLVKYPVKMAKNKKPIGRPKGYSPGPRKILNQFYGEWSWDSNLLWSKVTKQPGCWTWSGATGPYGCLFGAYKNGRQQMTQVRRLVYAEVNNTDVTELSIFHTCSNIYCVNPDHMQSGANQRIGLKKFR